MHPSPGKAIVCPGITSKTAILILAVNGHFFVQAETNSDSTPTDALHLLGWLNPANPVTAQWPCLSNSLFREIKARAS
ncbi:hypothetical protein WJX73_002759 [Symbiochloris irregularis]|uniref:Uncharacterized protein n=1 Tax=Symbiochloris irregularis TaxID=706552 RepID=A0AAW1P5C8_9CHLO